MTQPIGYTVKRVSTLAKAKAMGNWPGRTQSFGIVKSRLDCVCEKNNA